MYMHGVYQMRQRSEFIAVFFGYFIFFAHLIYNLILLDYYYYIHKSFSCSYLNWNENYN